jgi:FKBP-type peptidyl-prolyl cis-trans isomerase SlyD
MQITENHVVTFHYTLKNDRGELIESSVGREPLDYLHGHRNIIPGLESELAGKSAGDEFTATIEPVNAYGEYDESMVQKLSRADFEGVEEFAMGMRFEVEDKDGVGLVTVTKIQGDAITVDGNHPLAGERLVFDIVVVDIREASAEELTHGHAHHPDGHHH